MKKLIGFALWFIALVIPFQTALLSTDGVSNFAGLASFLALLALFYTGYVLVDSSNSKAAESH